MYLLGKLCKNKNPIYIALMKVYFVVKEYLTVHLYIDMH